MMRNLHIIKNYNICIVNFRSLITECEDTICAELEKYDLCKSVKINKDIKSILLHHFFYHICKFFSEKNTAYKYVFYFDNKDINFNLCDFSKESVSSVITNIIDKISHVLPLRFYNYNDLTFSQYVEKLHKDSGECRECLMCLIACIDSNSFENFTFNKTLSFIKRHNLSLINDHLFTTLKAKQLLLK